MSDSTGEIDKVTSQHGIRTCEWNENKRECCDNNTEVVIAKITFDKGHPVKTDDIEDYSSHRLSTMSTDQIASLFEEIVKSKQHVPLMKCDCLFSARSVHVKGDINDKAFVFVMGTLDPEFQNKHLNPSSPIDPDDPAKIRHFLPRESSSIS
ncbi:MAG: hypothetical protein IT584_01810 [Chlamydiae bacterium]|nr:hypothetical protein [Chlamydiota bacterium]